jgi:hypothetical protein
LAAFDWNRYHAMPRRPFRLGRALTGLGLFATQPIKRRTRLAEYKGRRLNLEQALKAEASGNRYLFEVNSKWTIDGKSRSNIARYFNHSCYANTDTTIRNGRVFIFSLRNIKEGEELTYDYGRDYLKNVIGLHRCKCKRCRKRKAKRARELRDLRNGVKPAAKRKKTRKTAAKRGRAKR